MGEVGGRLFIIFGGFMGFVLSFAASFLAGNDFSGVLMTASIGCVVGTILMKAFQKVIMDNVKASKIQRIEKEEVQEELEKLDKEKRK